MVARSVFVLILIAYVRLYLKIETENHESMKNIVSK